VVAVVPLDALVIGGLQYGVFGAPGKYRRLQE